MYVLFYGVHDVCACLSGRYISLIAHPLLGMNLCMPMDILYTRNTQSAQYYAFRTQSPLHAVQSKYETAISNCPQADD